jgi:hypothetical protein
MDPHNFETPHTGQEATMLTARAMIAGAMVLDGAERMEVLESLALEPEAMPDPTGGTREELWCCMGDDDGGVGLRRAGEGWEVCEGDGGAWRGATPHEIAQTLAARLDAETGRLVQRGGEFDILVAGIPLGIVLKGEGAHRGLTLWAPRWVEIRTVKRDRGPMGASGGAGGSGKRFKVDDGQAVTPRRGPSEDQRGGARAALEVKGEGFAVRKGGRSGQAARARDGV